MKVTIEPTHSETGFNSSWDVNTSFTNGTWADLIKAFLNGWKIKSDGGGTDISAFTWESVVGDGDASVQSLSHVTTNTVLDDYSNTKWTPYRALYQAKYVTTENYSVTGSLVVYPQQNNIIFPRISSMVISTVTNANVVNDIYSVLKNVQTNLASLEERVTALES
jgi:hypothetical protein